jgi:hypothetical protein
MNECKDCIGEEKAVKKLGGRHSSWLSFVNVGRKGRNKQAPEKKREKTFLRRSKKERETGGRKGTIGRSEEEEKLKKRK